MQEKDKTTKNLEDYNDVFVDIYNTLLFGKDVLDEAELEDGPTETVRRDAQATLRAQFRDKAKMYRKGKLMLKTLGIENQSKVEKYMPVRIMRYDAATYDGQVENKCKCLLPAITIVLNLGDTAWNKPKNLVGLMDIPPELEPFVQDYRMEVFDVAFLDDEVINRFRSDFGIVARFLKNRREKPQDRTLFRDARVIKHVQAVMDFLTAVTGDDEYSRLYEESLKEREEKGEDVTVCEVIDMFKQEGRIEGRIEGHAAGRIEGREMAIMEMVQDGDLPIEKAAKKLKLSIEEFKRRMGERRYGVLNQ